MTADFYRGRRVMITGGLGFIGSNLALRLVELGADVLLVDSLIPDAGGNFANIEPVKDRLRVNVADIRQASTMNWLVRGQDVIFNLAGQVSHIDSMRDPHTDLEVNCRAQLTLLEACRHHNPGAKVVFAGTRQVYGRPDALPVTEQHLVRPTDVNGINKVAGEYYHLVYNNVFGVRACSLRLTNVYGPRQLIRHNRQGFIGWFIRLALDRRRDPGLRRRLADPRLRLSSTTPPTHSCAPEPPTPSTARSSTSAATSTGPMPTWWRCWSRLADGASFRFVEWPPDKKVDRHRQLLRRLVEVPGARPAGRRRCGCARASSGRWRSTASTTTTTLRPRRVVSIGARHEATS